MDWVNTILMLLLVAGHTELLVTFVNRIHAMRLSCGLLRQIRHLHDVLIPAFPVMLVWFVGIHGPGVLSGGSWADVSIGWAVYLTICALGAVGLVGSSAWRQLRMAPKSQLSNHSRTVDIEQRLGYRPIGAGPYRYLTRVPGNEIFRVEVSEKSYRLPRLPEEWDGLTILHLSDLHFAGTVDRPFFDQVMQLSQEMEPDLIVFTGDLLDSQPLVSWLPATLGRLKAPLGNFFILGNHDWNLDPNETRQCLTELGWQNVAGQCISLEHNGHRLEVAGTERPWMGEHPSFSTSSGDAVRLLLSHTPDNLPWARRQRVDLMLSGHNHGGQVVLPLIGPVYSPSIYGCRYSSGAFWEEPTLLHVSRGVSALRPLRWRCSPEVTKLVLKAPVAQPQPVS